MTANILTEILNDKPCIKLTPEATVNDAVTMMKRTHCGAVAIMKEGHLVGIFTERDLLTRVVAESLDPLKTKLKQVMSANPITAQMSDGLRDAIAKMSLHGIRHMPVLNKHKLIGILTVRHLYKEICEMFERKITEQDALISYMFGTEYGGMEVVIDEKISA